MVSALLALSLLDLGICFYADIEAGGDKYGIENEYDISHLWGARERAAALGCTSFALHAESFTGSAAVLQMGASLLQILLAFLHFAVVFWLAFDYRLNKRRKLAATYIGLDPETAATDKKALLFLARYKEPGKALLALKICLALLTFGVYGAALLLK